MAVDKDYNLENSQPCWICRHRHLKDAFAHNYVIRTHISWAGLYYTIIDFNKVDMRIYLPEEVIFTKPQGLSDYHF